MSVPSVLAQDNTITWTGSGDGEDWFGEDNWSPTGEPDSTKDVFVNTTDADVTINKTYEAKSITVGGSAESTVTSENFIFGTVSPDTVNDVAVLNRKDGHLVLKGAGTVTLTGQYQDSEETTANQPTFMFVVS